MAKYDYGGGCPCGLEYECPPSCHHYVPKKEEFKMNKPSMNLEEFDFGFSAVNESELDSIKELEAKAQSLAIQAQEKEQLGVAVNEKLKKMYGMIVPLLDNLAKDPEKSYIYWPDRQKKLSAFKQKLKDVIDS